MIEAKLRTSLGQFKLDVKFESSGISCVAGRNGAGKTALLRAIAGFLKIDEGYVRVGGVDVTHLPVENRGVVMVTPHSSFPHLEVDSHITWGARLRGKMPVPDEVSNIKTALGIDFRGRVGKLSLGMRERVSLAAALLASPKVIMVDEAFSNLHDRDHFIATYGGLVKAAGTDLVFTSQDLADGKLAEHLFVMNDGMMRNG